MCEYCNKNKEKMICLVKSFGKLNINSKDTLELVIYGNLIFLGDTEDRYDTGVLKINYCPMCGIKLKEEYQV